MLRTRITKLVTIATITFFLLLQSLRVTQSLRVRFVHLMCSWWAILSMHLVQTVVLAPLR
jgi:hypothetical protein